MLASPLTKDCTEKVKLVSAFNSGVVNLSFLSEESKVIQLGIASLLFEIKEYAIAVLPETEHVRIMSIS